MSVPVWSPLPLIAARGSAMSAPLELGRSQKEGQPIARFAVAVRFARQWEAAQNVRHQAILASKIAFTGFEIDPGPLDSIAAERDGELPAPQQCPHPVGGPVGVALRRRI